jgi:hypothetical protein
VVFQVPAPTGKHAVGTTAWHVPDDMTDARATSTFVTAVGWTFLVLSVFAALVLMLRSVAVRSFLSGAQTDTLANGPEAANVALQVRFVGVGLVFLILRLIPLFTFCSSLGLLRRREWARKAFIGIMVFGILWNIGSAVVDTILFSANSPYNDASRPGEFRGMTPAVLALTWIFAIVTSALFFWIIKRLASPSVRAEFRALA